jgi:hypothetical protein
MVNGMTRTFVLALLFIFSAWPAVEEYKNLTRKCIGFLGAELFQKHRFEDKL